MICKSCVTLRLPESLHNRAKELAQEDGVSMNQFIMLALAEKVATLNAENYLQIRGQRASREKFLAAMGQLPDVEPPDERDRFLPSQE